MPDIPNTNLTSFDVIMRAKKSIPSYQRDFVWEDSLVISFLDNIYDAFERKVPNYFTGSMVFYKTKGIDAYEIVDGQQRITVLYILISEILKKIKEIHPLDSFPEQEKVKYIFAQTGISKSEYFFTHRVIKIKKYLNAIGDGKTHEYINSEDILLKSLKSCQEIVQGFIDDVDKEDLEHFYNYILNDVKVISYLAADINEALLIYSRLNSGGKILGHLEIIKGQLFGYVDKDTSANWDELDRLWEDFWQLFKTHIQIGGVHHFKPLIPEETFISYYFFVRHPELVNDLPKISDGFLPTNKISEFLLNKNLNKKIFKDPVKFVEDLIEFTKNVQNLRQGNNQDEEITNILKDIALLSQTQPLMFLLSCLNRDILDKDIVDRVFYLVFIFSMSVTGSGSTSKTWRSLGSAVNSTDKDIEQKDFIKLITKRLDEEISNYWNSHFENLFEAVRIDRAKKKTKTILIVLEIALRRYAGFEDKKYYNEFLYRRNLDIDHLHPQNQPLKNEPDVEKQEKSIQSIGNAGFLTDSDNSALKDSLFSSQKKQDALKMSEMFGTRSVARDDGNGKEETALSKISQAFEMNAAEIEIRKKEMLAILKEFCSSSLIDDSKKSKKNQNLLTK